MQVAWHAPIIEVQARPGLFLLLKRDDDDGFRKAGDGSHYFSIARAIPILIY